MESSMHGRPAKLRALGIYGTLSKLSWAWMRARGWSIAISDPLPEKCVIIVYQLGFPDWSTHQMGGRFDGEA
jgi:hypothetical protein